MAVKFINVSDSIGRQEKLDICINTATSVSVLQWQCQGKFIAHNDKGVILDDDSHIKKARSFIEVAKKSNAGLVLTPEYSFPYSVLEEIIDNKETWPEKGKLWCLGTQGDSYSSFKSRIDRWKSIHCVNVVDEAYESIVKIKNFVSPLIYLFKSETGELLIIPQFKTGPMHDVWNDYEGRYLCEGNAIFVFDLVGNTNSKNRFLSLICSDILYIKAHEVVDNIGDEFNITIFHPQLNQKPRHTDFINFRDRFINNSNKDNKRLITLNWGEETRESTTNLKFDTPWSAFYQRTKYEDIETLILNSKPRALRMKNHKRGLFYAYNKDYRIDIWFSSPKEHCKLFEISKTDVGTANPIATHKNEPIAVHDYSYDVEKMRWVEERCICTKDALNIIGYLDSEYDYPMRVCTETPQTCSKDMCVMDKCDFFFGSCFGYFEEGQIICDKNELIERINVYGDISTNCNRKQKAELFNVLVELLKDGVFPKELEEFKDNHKFEIDEDRFPIMHKEKHNLCAINTTDQYMKAIVAITESRDEAIVEKMVSDLKKQLHPNYRGQVLVYYQSGAKFTYFDKYFHQTKISNGNINRKIESIT